MVDKEKVRSGFVAVAGRPNTGKSTLVNRLAGGKVAITSPRPQTTRNRIIGIMTRPGLQIVFVDTPGVMRKKGSALNAALVETAIRSIEDCDAVLLVTDAARPDTDEERYVLGRLARASAPMALVINKIDIVKKPLLLERIGELSKLRKFDEVLLLSAKTGEGVDELVEYLSGVLPEGPAFYPPDMITDQPESFMIAEIIREKLFYSLQQEIPYSTAVLTTGVEDTPRGAVVITADIYVERESQKGIVIGKGGAMLKKTGAAARAEIERRLGAKVFLDLSVKVEKKWTRGRKGVSRLGYGGDFS
ncbi:MAG: GTPase Era [Candidatus Nitrospinota bacterium M3_3B_026]